MTMRASGAAASTIEPTATRLVEVSDLKPVPDQLPEDSGLPLVGRLFDFIKDPLALMR